MNNRHILLTATLALTLGLSAAQAQVVPNVFSNGQLADANQVNANFDALASAIFGGNGSAGDLVVSVDVDWTNSPPANPNFADITIDAGHTLTVPAGTTIRCSGAFTNNGTLTVRQGARMASLNNFAFNATPDIISVGHPGDSFRPASSGAYYTDGIANPRLIQGGMGGQGIPQATAITSFNSFRIGGGSGSGWRDSGRDGDGGGLVRIYCTGAITNAGTINAVGGTSNTLSGGGGGGIVILASPTSVDNAGTINANGGNGGPSFSFGGAGGGGGGGIVVFAAPTVAAGTVNVAGGVAGSTAAQVTDNDRLGGGAGGASGGAGGDGSDIPAAAAATPSTPGAGGLGYTIEILANPAFLLH